MPPPIEQLYHALEFDIVLEKIASFAGSVLGKEEILAAVPIPTREELELRMALVHESLDIVRYDDPFPVQGIHDIRESLELAAIEGGSLSIERLVAVGETLIVCGNIQKYLMARKLKYPHLAGLFKETSTFKELSRSIFDIIDPESGEVRDKASSELARLRRTLRSELDRVRAKMNEIMSKSKDYLQDNIITIREGRMVIPLRDDCKGRIEGFVHDRSSSGATLFIEPTAIFDMNNHIRELQIDERREIERLLRDLTSKVRDQLDDIRQTLPVLAKLDALIGIALFGKKWQGTVPGLSESKLNIVRGYHPLLLLKHGERDKVVPLNFELDNEAFLLIITGPNAGGKTVALKTIGLSVLLFQCGFPVMADERSEFPIIDRIFVDIGDSQSIEHDLSTFSAHVARLADILAHATAKSIVLIDEVGTGTDPAEGSALSVAFLQKLHGLGTKTVATTHQGALKAFAHDLPGAENGSMAFDEKTLTPTYEFRMGIPGSSYAFEIAKRLGLPEDVIEEARKVVGKEHGKLEDFISELEHKLNHYKHLLNENEIKRSELEALTKLYGERYKTLQNEEKKYKKEALEESKAILARANAVIEKAVKDIRANQADKTSVKRVRQEVDAVKKEVERQLKPLTEKETLDGEPPQRGDRAEWTEMKIKGEVTSDLDAKGQVVFEAGDMKLRLPQKSLRRLEPKPEKEASSRHAGISLGMDEDLRSELDLRGMTMDEAQPVLEKYLDRAYLAGLEQARIIHGKGTGALRKKVNIFLKSYQRITDFHKAGWNEGDTGVTVVHFKKS